MKPIEPPTQIPRIFLVTDRSPTQQQDRPVRYNQLLLIALLMTSSLFTLILASLPHLSLLWTSRSAHAHQTSSAIPTAPQPAPVVLHIQQPDGSNLTLKVIAAPAQPSDANISVMPSAYSSQTATKIILNAVPQPAEIIHDVNEVNAERNCSIN